MWSFKNYLSVFKLDYFLNGANRNILFNKELGDLESLPMEC